MSVVRLTRAERRERTREELIAAADRRFVAGGFHATSVDEVAADAGYTKGAVYSNFASKEDLFFAVYERRMELGLQVIARAVEEHGVTEGHARLATDTLARRGRDDGWIAVFFEFWAHVVRHEELRERFTAIHGRLHEAMARGFAGVASPAQAGELAVALNAMQLGLALERLTMPDRVDVELAARMARLVLEDFERRDR